MPGLALPRQIREQRHQFALQQLAAGQPFTSVVAEVSDRYGCSRRHARNVCHAVMDEIANDYEAVDHLHLLASTINRLERLALKAEADKQYGAGVGAIRTLADLVLAPRMGKGSSQTRVGGSPGG